MAVELLNTQLVYWPIKKLLQNQSANYHLALRTDPFIAWVPASSQRSGTRLCTCQCVCHCKFMVLLFSIQVEVLALGDTDHEFVSHNINSGY